jgi:hypothetical protein
MATVTLNKNINKAGINNLFNLVQGKATMTIKTKLVWKANKQKVNLSNIDDPLAKTKDQLVNRPVKGDLLQEKKYNQLIEFYQANDITFDLDLMPKFELIPIKEFLIPEEVQRLLDVPHCIDILKKFDPRLLSPIYVVRLKGTDMVLVFDSMHTLETIAAITKSGLWSFTNPKTGERERLNSKNWDNFLVNAYVIETDDESFAALAALYRNGEGSKPWLPYDYHRVEDRSYVYYGNEGPNGKYKLAHEKQMLMVANNSVPLPKGHKQLGQVGTLGHIEAVMNYEADSMDELEFILKTNNKYWNGHNDSSMFGFYGHIYKDFIGANQKVSGKAFDAYMDEIHAIIKTLFTSMPELKSATIAAYKDYCIKIKKNPSTAPHNCALAIVEKVYKKLGGKHNVTRNAIDFTHSPSTTVTFDIYDSLPLSIRHDISNKYTL